MESLVEKLMANKILKKPLIHLMVDFIMKLLLATEKNAIWVVYNRLSKMTYFVTTIEKTIAEELARLFRDNV